jgi:hypothetical protein
MPEMVLRIVVLPAPLEPSTVTTEPGATESDTPRIALTAP